MKIQNSKFIKSFQEFCIIKSSQKQKQKFWFISFQSLHSKPIFFNFNDNCYNFILINFLFKIRKEWTALFSADLIWCCLFFKKNSMMPNGIKWFGVVFWTCNIVFLFYPFVLEPKKTLVYFFVKSIWKSYQIKWIGSLNPMIW